MRIGQGFDVHAFGAGDAVILGGVSIPYSQGLKAHSDGDVLLHSLADALLARLPWGISVIYSLIPAPSGRVRIAGICCVG